MKKLFFLCVFLFMSMQIQAQMYIVTLSQPSSSHPESSCTSTYDVIMTTIDPQGNITYDCLPNGGQLNYGGSNIALLNQKFNSITSLGYKLVATDSGNNIITAMWKQGAWYFAVP